MSSTLSDTKKARRSALMKANYQANKAKKLAYQKKYRESHREKILVQQKLRYAATKEERAAYSKERYKSRREERTEKRKIYWENHRAKILETNRRYRAAHREEIREQKKVYGQAHAAEGLARGAKWRKANPDKIAAKNTRSRAARKAAPGTHTAADIKKIWEIQKHKCAVKNCPHPIAASGNHRYHVDHVKALANGGSNWANNLQILCVRHNTQKKDKDEYVWAQEHGMLFV